VHVREVFSNQNSRLGLAGGKVQNKVVRVRGATSNQNPRFGLAGGKAQTKMVRAAGLEPARSFPIEGF
jgi:hypothetical protein